MQLVDRQKGRLGIGRKREGRGVETEKVWLSRGGGINARDTGYVHVQSRAIGL